MVRIKEFEREYIKSMQDGTASIFAGAGLSRPSGFVDWRGLLRNLASDINLDIDKEHDLITLAQYYCNSRGGRGAVNQRILNSFSQGIKNNESISGLIKLPIDTYWTTNYDRLLEENLIQAGKTVDVKIRPESLAIAKEDRDVTVYKMHGDFEEPSFCVITKDDYESYNMTRQLFTTALQGDLVTKTFLFIGISLDDPNINYILGKIRVLLGENSRPHFWLIEKVHQRQNESLLDFEYRRGKQALRVQDLLRYSIHAVEIEKYADIPILLSNMYEKVNRNRIFISGSAKDYGGKWEKNAMTFIRELSKQLIRNKYKIVTGHGVGVGSFVISAVVEESLQQNKHINKMLEIFAFPYEESQRTDYDEIKSVYRNTIIDGVGVAIFIFGNRESKNSIELSNGVWEEYLIAKSKGKIIIPVGSTGYQASEILEDLLRSSVNTDYLTNHIDILRSSLNYLEITKCIEIILENINNRVN